jgi:hypothetical protein
MKVTKKHRLLLAGLLGLVVIAAPGKILAQAPPGPLPQVQSQDHPAVARPVPPPAKPRTSIMGAWKLNHDDSDDPRQKMQQARGSSDSGRSRVGMGGGYPGGMGGHGGYGGHGGSRGGESDDDREKTQAFIAPSNSLSLEQKDGEVDVTDDQYRKLSIFTDGRKLQKSKDIANQEIAAHWNDKSLVTDEKSPRGGKMSRTFELSPDGTQLYETLHLTVGRDSKSVGIRYVYDQAPQSAADSKK